MPDETRSRLTAFVRGQVQGVGFRWWVRSRALELGLAGTATNLADGRVEIVVEGPRHRVDQLLEQLDGNSPDRPGFVVGVTAQWSAPRGTPPGFVEA